MNRTREASYCSEPVPVISSDRNRAFVRRSLSPFVARADLGNGVERSRSWSTRQRSYLDDEDEKDDEVFQQQEVTFVNWLLLFFPVAVRVAVNVLVKSLCVTDVSWCVVLRLRR